MKTLNSVDIEYLRRHNVAETLEVVTRGLLETKPEVIEERIVVVLKEMRIQAKAKSLEDFLESGEMSPSARGEVDKQIGNIVSLERDESLRSENSTFSINSTDMAEFLSDITGAFMQVSKSRVLNGRVTKNDLGDIIDLIAYPIPEKVLCEMFNEVDADNQGAIDYTECIARMTYKIHGRFHIDALRPLYESAAGGTPLAMPSTSLPEVVRKLGLQSTHEDIAEAAAHCMVAGEEDCVVSFTTFIEIVNRLTGYDPRSEIESERSEGDSSV